MKTAAATTLAALLASLPLAAPAQDYAPGEKLTLQHCGRCHVVSAKNKYGSIGSTPSFAAMRNRPDFEERMLVFYTLLPHPAFTQVEGVTEPFPANRPSPIAPLRLTRDEIETIARYAMTIPPKDLGGTMSVR